MTDINSRDYDFMRQALEMARAAAASDEVPVGAILIDPSREKIYRTFNRTRKLSDPTAHAEILAIRQAASDLSNERLLGFEMYVTLEPCTMCAAAISFARISKLFFATPDPKGGACTSGVRFFESATCHHKPTVHSGIYAEESAQVLREFFAKKRK